MKKLFIKIFKILTIIFVIGIVLFITFILLMFLVFTEVMSYLTLSFLIVFGWIGGLFQWMKGLTIEPAALMTGFIAFLLFLYFLHRTIRAFNSDWLFRRSIGLAGILLAVSVSAIALICAVHNIYRLNNTKHWLTDSKNNLPQSLVIFAFCDGSVRALNKNMDPKSLITLSMPGRKSLEKGALNEE